MNKKKSLLVISSYPPKSSIHEKRVVGGASYTKLTLLALNEYASITVLAEKLKDDKTLEYQENGISVIRLWKRNSLLSFPKILKYILLNYKRIDKILFEFEFAMFGGITSLVFFILFLGLTRILGKQVTIALHQVIPNIEDIGEHVNIHQGSIKQSLYTIAINLFYRLMLKTANKIIVFEEHFRKVLADFGNVQKIAVIPHGVETFNNSITTNDARKMLKIPESRFVILAFGFLAWYKGSDWLVENFPAKDLLILAGGANPNRLDKPYYKSYLSRLEKKCNQSNIRLTGFIPEDKIPLYFQAADITVFPYRTFMSASGPLSMAFSFKKPFLLSKKLSPLFETKDVKNILESYTINKDDLFFANSNDLKKRIEDYQDNKKLQQKVRQLSSNIGKARSWKIIGKLYYNELFTH